MTYATNNQIEQLQPSSSNSRDREPSENALRRAESDYAAIQRAKTALKEAGMLEPTSGESS